MKSDFNFISRLSASRNRFKHLQKIISLKRTANFANSDESLERFESNKIWSEQEFEQENIRRVWVIVALEWLLEMIRWNFGKLTGLRLKIIDSNDFIEKKQIKEIKFRVLNKILNKVSIWESQSVRWTSMNFHWSFKTFEFFRWHQREVCISDTRKFSERECVLPDGNALSDWGRFEFLSVVLKVQQMSSQFELRMRYICDLCSMVSRVVSIGISGDSESIYNLQISRSCELRNLRSVSMQ